MAIIINEKWYFFAQTAPFFTTTVFLFDNLSDSWSLILLRFKTPTLNNPIAVAGKKSNQSICLANIK